ncbi:AraC family transcriptional regulator [uncultured Ruminococcus sp.]|uniref:AraC family transcriptional regulator n=1 Tax=uncultured Ruminococcus sp. TaxID=165186 RepID=UPI00259A4426|nr:AraC family transcriptional regulator [uncultured Ruminococcus sp.]
MNINQDLQEQLFRQREEQICHLDYNQEFRYYNAVASGDMESVKEYLMPENDDAYSGSEYGKLSQNSLWNARYHFVVAVALITRICVEHHMEREIAYTLSDVFVQKIDDCKTVAEIAALHNIMVRDFTKRMQLLQKAAYSMHVARAIDYITIHLHEKLQTGNIADAISINRGYLSTLFRQETGKSLHDYILAEKIHAAAQMITTSEMSFSEISQYYSFSSQSHFIQCFRKELGMTPLEYRKRYYRSSEVSEGNTE